jgi:cell division protein FtsI (penicillin-binding protein 3)
MDRFKLLKYAFFFLIFCIMMRLGYWQIIKSDDLSAKAEDQRLASREIEAPRGEVLFFDRSVLASTQPTFLVYIQPQVIKNDPSLKKTGVSAYQKDLASKIAQIFYEDDLKKRPPIIETNPESSPSAEEEKVKLSPEEEKKQKLEELEKSILSKLDKNLYWVSLGRNVDINIKDRIEKLNLIGVGFEKGSSRFYPEGSSSAHLLGFVGSDAYGIETGYFGVEGFYNGELKGKKGLYTEERDALGIPILIGKYTQREPQPGKTLILTVDRTVQHIVEEKLQKGLLKYQAKSASAIVLDPNTGNILAMASYPAYDPSRVLDYPKENFKNPIVADGYEPGSTFKVLIMAAGINEGLVTPQTVCDICAGPVNLGGFTIRTWNNQYKANSTMTDVLTHSDNTGMVFISRKLGLEKLYKYITQFGMGSLTGIDLQDEQSPELRPYKDWKEIDQATVSFGQGISTTALQIVRAVAAIANGGKLMEPHMVAEIRDSKGNNTTIIPKVIGQPITPETAKTVTNMMVEAVDKGEANYYKKIEGVGNFKIAGKTGTAQVAVAGHYDESKTIASFVGFAPADKPKFIILVRYAEPKSSIFGADTAAPTFFDIAHDLFSYYGIAPNN